MEPYRVFEGPKFIDAMLELRRADYTPLCARHVAQQRIDALASGEKESLEFWLDNWFSLPDGIATYKDKITVVPRSKILTDVWHFIEQPDKELKNGGLILTKDQFNGLDGITLKRGELKLDEALSAKEAKAHPVWQALLSDTLDEYVDEIFLAYKARHGASNLMEVYLASESDVPLLRASDLFGLDDRSGLGDLHDFDGDARLVGVHDNINDQTV